MAQHSGLSRVPTEVVCVVLRSLLASVMHPAFYFARNQGGVDASALPVLAGLWYVARLVRVKPVLSPSRVGGPNGEISFDTYDLLHGPVFHVEGAGGSDQFGEESEGGDDGDDEAVTAGGQGEDEVPEEVVDDAEEHDSENVNAAGNEPAGESAGDEEDQGENNEDGDKASVTDATTQSVDTEAVNADEVKPTLKRTQGEDAEYEGDDETGAAKKSKTCWFRI
ncbi:uncharacterized protein BDV14DRAFT_201763 [Aspergillus stella-maris]|uniref:uncharacterized protein n=1 Tax=Aspergillus stella-maris TaxID=1810926 RepID=UPI003CCDA746